MPASRTRPFIVRLTSRLISRLGAFLCPLLGVILLGTTLTAAPAAASAVDEYADYDPQTTCASAVKPGTAYLLAWLRQQYPGTRSSSTLRPCSSGTSEHKDGRALDWGVDVADAREKAQAYAFLDRIFAADRRGNPDALARRMGIMYVIWNDRIYRSYDGFSSGDYSHSACDGPLRTCSKTLRHRDHVHISLSRAGAAAQTSFYRDRGVNPEPVLVPGTRLLDAQATAVARMVVPGNGQTVSSTFKVQRGQTYRIVGDGLHRYGPGAQVEDAACRWSARAGKWVRSIRTLLVNETSPWADTCGASHTHSATYTARRTGLLHLRVADTTPRGNSGSLSFYILREDISARSVATSYPAARRAPRVARTSGPRARGLVREAVQVRAAAGRGVSTHRALRKGARYRVVVTGAAENGSQLFDGSCARYAGRMRAQHSLDLTRPSADHLALYVQGVRLQLRVPGSTAACSERSHRYVGRYRAVVGGKAKVRIWDPYSYGDNAGALRVTLRRI